MQRSGIADLPLHGGSVPRWLADRMTALGTAITEHMVHHYGVSAFLSRLADPFWFQALGSVMGMDWHSSGITTSVLGALKRGINPTAVTTARMRCEWATTPCWDTVGGNIALEFLYSGPHSLLSRMHLNNGHGAPSNRNPSAGSTP
jgi:hypothetical protein